MGQRHNRQAKYVLTFEVKNSSDQFTQIGFTSSCLAFYRFLYFLTDAFEVFISFKITGTDYGTLNCTYEEYENGSATHRINYYDIPTDAFEVFSGSFCQIIFNTGIRERNVLCAI